MKLESAGTSVPRTALQFTPALPVSSFCLNVGTTYSFPSSTYLRLPPHSGHRTGSQMNCYVQAIFILEVH